MQLYGSVGAGSGVDGAFHRAPGIANGTGGFEHQCHSGAAFLASAAPAGIAVGADGLTAGFSGLLHNRAELAATLGLDRAAPPAALLVAAHDRWGQALFSRLLGDFACAIWDPGRRRLLLARDPLAGRPLFYAEQRGRLHFASTMQALRGIAGVDGRLVEAGLVARLLNRGEDGPDTWFSGIARVAPGHCWFTRMAAPARNAGGILNASRRCGWPIIANMPRVCVQCSTGQWPTACRARGRSPPR